MRITQDTPSLLKLEQKPLYPLLHYIIRLLIASIFCLLGVVPVLESDMGTLRVSVLNHSK